MNALRSICAAALWVVALAPLAAGALGTWLLAGDTALTGHDNA